jgi:hypothetical protein
MSRVRTLIELQIALDRDFAWRVREVSSLKAASRTNKIIPEDTAVRAGIALTYAHWEGFVKNAACTYVEYVSNQRLEYRELPSCFAAMGLKGRLGILSNAESPEAYTAAFEFVRSQLTEPATLVPTRAIGTQSNLSSDVFRKIVCAIGLSFAVYETHCNFIDSSLVNMRNGIAHGEYPELDLIGWGSLVDRTLTLMRTFKSEIENNASLKTFKV